MADIQNMMIEAAKRYAAANRSDPFAFSRAVTHIRTGVAAYQNQHGEPAYYNAEAYTEMRKLPDGTTYPATAYKNVVVPCAG